MEKYCTAGHAADNEIYGARESHAGYLSLQTYTQNM